MGANDQDPEYDAPVDDPQGEGTGDDTSRAADTSRSTATGAPSGGRPGGSDDTTGSTRPGSTSSAGSSTGAGAQVPSGLLREANRRIRALETQLAARGETRPADRREPDRRPEDDLDPESRQIRDQLFKLVPALKWLEKLDPSAVDRVMNEVAPQSQALEKLYWQRNANTHLREVESLVRTEYGDKVDPKAVRRFQAGFIDWIESDPDARERYLDGDPSLVKDYWAETTGLIVEPIRSKVSSEAVSRAERVNRLPVMPKRGGPIGAPRRGEKKPKTEDELHDQAWDALVERAGALAR